MSNGLVCVAAAAALMVGEAAGTAGAPTADGAMGSASFGLQPVNAIAPMVPSKTKGKVCNFILHSVQLVKNFCKRVPGSILIPHG